MSESLFRAILSTGGYPEVRARVGAPTAYQPVRRQVTVAEELLRSPAVLQWVLAHEMTHREQFRRGKGKEFIISLLERVLPHDRRPSEREADELADYYLAVLRNRARRGQGSYPLGPVLSTRVGR